MRKRLGDFRAILQGLLLPMLTLYGCATDPLIQIAKQSGFTDETVIGSPYRHRILGGDGQGQGKYLHVYLDGDGRPWLSGNRVSADPSPRNPMMLRMMSLDSASRLYVGRPCYHSVKDALCELSLWTGARYSAEVVASLNEVISQYAGAYQGIVLMGYSGGATLAMLLANKRNDVVAVVTIAGNLDIDGWTEFHQFSPLKNSLNPTLQRPLPLEIVQLHYLGAEDKNIPRAVHQLAVEHQNQASPILVSGFNHQCCWQDRWPQILQKLEASLKFPSDNQQ